MSNKVIEATRAIFNSEKVPLELAGHVIQINLVHRPGHKINVLASFNVWRKGGSFGFADDLLRFCNTPRCLGLFDYDFTLTEAEVEHIKKHIKDVFGYNDIVLEGSADFWPEDLKNRHNTWYEQTVLCPKCGAAAVRQDLCDSYVMNHTLDMIATRATDLYYELEADADFYLVRTKKSHLIHQANAELRETVKPDMERYARLLDEAKQQEKVFYSNMQVSRDSANGKLVKDCVLGLLRA